DQLVLRCLAKAPQDRFSSMAELAAALEGVLAHISSSPAAALPTVMMTPLPAGYRSEYPGAAARSVPPVHPTPAREPAAAGPMTVRVTTLSAASGLVVARPPAGRRRPGLWIALALLVACAGGGAVWVAARAADAPSAPEIRAGGPATVDPASQPRT